MPGMNTAAKIGADSSQKAIVDVSRRIIRFDPDFQGLTLIFRVKSMESGQTDTGNRNNVKK